MSMHISMHMFVHISVHMSIDMSICMSLRTMRTCCEEDSGVLTDAKLDRCVGVVDLRPSGIIGDISASSQGAMLEGRCIDVCMDMRTGMCEEMWVDMWVDIRRQMHSHVYGDVDRRVPWDTAHVYGDVDRRVPWDTAHVYGDVDRHIPWDIKDECRVARC